MIIQCGSCQKKFKVPDSAITASGRLVQCSSCGNKWTQYPLTKKTIPITKVVTKAKNIKKIKKIKKSKKKAIETYSEEYLQKKHGIKIIDPSSSNLSSNKKRGNKKTVNVGFGFYNYLIFFVVFVLTFFGILNLTKDLLILYFPNLEYSINYIYETINNISLIINDIVSNY